MEEKVKFSENVILIDVAFLNEVASGARGFLSEKVGRELPDIDLPRWLSYLSLDAGLRESDHEIQVLLVHDDATTHFTCCTPTDIKKLDGTACRIGLGELQFLSVPTAGMISSEKLYLDLLNLLLDAAEVKRLMLVPFYPVYAEKVEKALHDFFREKSREERERVVYFVSNEPAEPVFCSCDSIAYSLIKALGIQPDEMK